MLLGTRQEDAVALIGDLTMRVGDKNPQADVPGRIDRVGAVGGWRDGSW